MNKKLMAVAMAVVLLSFVFASCGKKENFKAEETRVYEPIEFITNENGDKFIQNKFGDLIPVTTGKDGSMELIDDLYTKPKEQADKEKEEMEKEEGKHQNPENQTPENQTPENNTPQTPDSEDGIQILDKEPANDDGYAHVVW